MKGSQRSAMKALHLKNQAIKEAKKINHNANAEDISA